MNAGNIVVWSIGIAVAVIIGLPAVLFIIKESMSYWGF